MMKIRRVMAKAIPKDIHMMLMFKNERYCWMFMKVEVSRKSPTVESEVSLTVFGCTWMRVSGFVNLVYNLY